MNNKKKTYLKIINKIQKVRQTNNKNWMDLLRLSFSLDPENSRKIVKQIFKRDTQISNLVKQLTKK
tara:strand:- start:475 stop:672 length:198 start_codon:yes stop_codon:yes gene_type:complete